MRRTDPPPTKADSFNFRVDPDLKAAFTAAAEAEDRPAGQILRDFMRFYVEQRSRRAFEKEARRQSRMVAGAPDEAEVMRWMEQVADTEGWH